MISAKRSLLAAWLLLALLAAGCEAGSTSDGGADGAGDAGSDGEAGQPEAGAELTFCSPAGWTVLQSGVSDDLFGVWGASPAQLVAAGSDGTVLRLEGTRWRAASALPAGVEQVTWRAVWGASAQEIYLAGDRGALLRFNGVSWRRETLPAAAREHDLLAVGGGLGQGEVFAVGSNSTLLRRDSTGWRTLAAPAELLQLTALAVAGEELLAVGGSLSPATAAALRYRDASWQQAPGFPQASGQLLGLWGDQQGRALAVGRGGPGAAPPLLWLEAGRWSSTPAAGLGPTDVLTAVWGASVQPLLIVGGGGVNAGGLVLRFDGQRFERLELPADVPRLNALWGWPSGEVILVGDQGTALRYCEPPAP